MLHDARTDRRRGVWVRRDTGEAVRWLRWYDDATQEFSAFRADPEASQAAGVPLVALAYFGRAPLDFVADPLPRRRLLPPGEVRLCDEPKCHARAVWGVADIAEAAPVLGPDGRPYRAAAVTGRRFYCDAHWRAPTRTSRRGVVSEITEVVQP